MRIKSNLQRCCTASGEREGLSCWSGKNVKLQEVKPGWILVDVLSFTTVSLLAADGVDWILAVTEKCGKVEGVTGDDLRTVLRVM